MCHYITCVTILYVSLYYMCQYIKCVIILFICCCFRYNKKENLRLVGNPKKVQPQMTSTLGN